jgi:cold shock protein
MRWDMLAQEEACLRYVGEEVAGEMDPAIGTVKWFNNAKGYGFIVAEDGADVFVHYSVIEMDGYRALQEGQSVLYEDRDTPKGRQAIKVTIPQ